ncbi:transposase [Methylorubrum sp. Q1]|uniref:IS66 family transposase n=1 Tax=Methylorubrum sp. Q1 TaxID=2562453 RepID=UPI002110C4C6|nr:transposase [Methylorubrum sp. Q1]
MSSAATTPPSRDWRRVWAGRRPDGSGSSVRDERPHGGVRPPAAVFLASPDCRGERPLAHLAGFQGVLHADGYAGFQRLYEGGRTGGALIEAACWAHTRRKFFDVHAKTGSAIAGEALERIGALYAVEREIAGQPPDERPRRRQDRSRPLADVLRARAETILPQLSGPSDLAKAFRYMLSRWRALTRVFDDGRIGLDNNPAERAAAFSTLIETAKLNGRDAEVSLRDVLTRIADHPARRLGDSIRGAGRSSIPPR